MVDRSDSCSLPRRSSRPRAFAPVILACGVLLAACAATDHGQARTASTPVAARVVASPAPPAAAPGTARSPSRAPGVEAAAVPAPKAAPASELPRGGRTLFPKYRLVGFCGTPGAPNLGKLDGNLDAKAKTIEGYATKYADGRTPLPVFELIAVVVQGAPGKDGMWRRRVEDSVVDQYLEAARKAKALLLLDIQPGQSDFATELRTFERWLREPDVGVALDPEWSVKKKQTPGKVYGHTTGDVIDDVAEYLSGIVEANDLPEKPLVFHELAPFIVSNEEAVKQHHGVVVIKSVDGLGPKGAKITSYGAVTKHTTKGVHVGFKLFFEEDTAGGRQIMSPPEVLKLRPQPEYVMYE
jgi:hypothetical protein